MLKIVRDIRELDVRKLTAVYVQSNQDNARKNYGNLPDNLQILEAEQDFYDYLRFFLKQQNAYYALWCHQGDYLAAVRVEPYLDGAILTGLETAPSFRNQGYATALIMAIQEKLSEQGFTKLYSHVHKNNSVSIAVHNRCSFRKISDEAHYIDGSTDNQAYTYLYEL